MAKNYKKPALRKVPRFSEGGLVVDPNDYSKAKTELARRLRNRERMIADEEKDLTLLEQDRLAATRDADARGDYNSSGHYQPFRPKRGD